MHLKHLCFLLVPFVLVFKSNIQDRGVLLIRTAPCPTEFTDTRVALRGGHPYITLLVITYWSDRNTESCNPTKRCTLIPIKPSACRQKQERRTLVLLFVTFGWAPVLFANWSHKSAALSAVFAIRGSSEQAENATAISCQGKKKKKTVICINTAAVVSLQPPRREDVSVI